MMAPNVDILTGQLPLKGVVLCCTSLPQDVRTELADAATQMGAIHKLDLTTDVTHLIVGSVATPKYRYVARERPDVKVLHPNWIKAIRETWMEGGDVDVAELEKKHHFPPFASLQICLTGFDDLEQRNFISSTLEEHGATYDGVMTKNTTTHLIAATPQGQKYKHAKIWGISVVSLKWFEDSLRRGMSVDESFYDPTLPLEEQGQGAFKHHVMPRTSLGKHGRESAAKSTGSVESDRKKLRRVASTRLEGQSQDMWLDMSAANISKEPSSANQWKDDDERITHVSETTFTTSMMTRSSGVKKQADTPSEVDQEPDGLFAGQYVLIHGFEQSKNALLEQILQQNGAKVVHSVSELEEASQHVFFRARCLLVPHAVSLKSLHLPEVPANTTTVSEWWVERCIHHKQLLSPAEDVLSVPLWDTEIQGFSDLLISTTGFTGVDLRQVAQAVKLMGATYQEKVLPSSSVLVSGSPSIRKEKAFYADKHKIPVVSAEWLWACLKTKKMVSFSKFALQLSAFDLKDFTGEASMHSPAPSNAPDGKASSTTKAKDDAPPKRLSTVRKKQATPSLALHAVEVHTAEAEAREQPNVLDDDDDGSTLDGEPVAPSRIGSHPLQERSPNLSPRKTGSASNGESDTSTASPANKNRQSRRSNSPPQPISEPPQGQAQSHNIQAHPAARSQHEMNADIAELVNRQASRPNSAAAAEPPKKRKDRPLGRAASGISHRSISTSTSAQSEKLSTSLPSDLPESASDGRNKAVEPLPPPSTQLGYETPEAEAHRLQMSKKMGAKLQDEGTMKRVASLGVVKDTTLAADTGVSNRVKGRQRAK